jgi:hypothetical protein
MLNHSLTAGYGNIKISSPTAPLWHKTCNTYKRATAWQKAMGEALFGNCSCQAAAIRDPRGPLIGSLIFSFDRTEGWENMGRILPGRILGQVQT